MNQSSWPKIVLIAAAGLAALLALGRRGPIVSIRDWLMGVLAWVSLCSESSSSSRWTGGSSA
jgi:hypothetical protein